MEPSAAHTPKANGTPNTVSTTQLTKREQLHLALYFDNDLAQ